MRLKSAGLSHVGMKRAQNQDSYLLAPDLRLFIVADGMGGHKGGETASLMAVNTIADYFRAMTASVRGSTTWGQDPVEKIHQAILSANSAIQSKGQSNASLQGMGTTTTAMYFTESSLYLGHVGDSRTYLVHPRRIWQLTRDHSLVQEKLRAGLITRAQVKTDRMKNVITRSVGFESDVDVDIYQMEPRPGDVFIICSDGLSGMIEDAQILELIEEYIFKQNNIELACKHLIETANANGGDDNVTAIIVQVA